jgi:succinyl-diaminopimelate desuccinylase
LADALKPSSAEAGIRRHVKAHAAQAVALLAELVRTPSDNPPGDCRAHAEKTATLLEALGLAVERHRVPASLCKRHGMITATNLIVRKRFAAGPTIALSAHGDVVPPGAGWTQDPYGADVKDGHMYGRGVEVSKSDIATYAFALLALQSVPVQLKGSVELHITYDEETGGEIGPHLLLEQGLSTPSFAIGAGFAYAVVTAHSGCLHMQVAVFGRSAHAALDGH